MAKKPVLAIQRVLNALDRKDKNFYDSLTKEEQKALSPFLLVRYASVVQGSEDLQAWYLAATNHYVNKGFFDISSTKHKKLQWLLLTTVSPGMGNQFHKWLGLMKRDGSGNTKKIKKIEKLFPEAGDDELRTLAHIYSDAELKSLAIDRGWDDKKIKDL